MILGDLGYDVESEEMSKTAERWLSVLYEYANGREVDFGFTTFDNPDYDEMIVEKDITFHSLCAHHLVPFTGVSHVAYIPDKKICGLSKLARAVDHFSHQLGNQEKITIDIANYLEKELEPVGVAVVIQAQHFCMSMRGVRKPGVYTTTSAIKGAFREEQTGARTEFMSLINGGR